MDGTAEWAMSHSRSRVSSCESSCNRKYERGAGTTPKLRFDHKLSVKYAKDQRVSVPRRLRCALVSVPANERKMIKESSRAMPIRRAVTTRPLIHSSTRPAIQSTVCPTGGSSGSSRCSLPLCLAIYVAAEWSHIARLGTCAHFAK